MPSETTRLIAAQLAVATIRQMDLTKVKPEGPLGVLKVYFETLDALEAEEKKRFKPPQAIFGKPG